MSLHATRKAIVNFFLHLHPFKVDSRAVKFNRTFGLGGIAALLSVILFVTGLMLKFVYVPSATHAYDSIVSLKQNLIFGNFIRNLHYWSAMLMVVVVFFHFIRVFYSQAIYAERRKNWIYGIVLFFLVLGANFTGYLLPWDQLSFWAVTIVTNMLSYIPVVGDSIAGIIRDGDAVTEKTLLRFYHFHTGLLPVLMIFFMSIHFWLVRKAGGIALPKVDKTEKVKVNPHLVYKEIFVALVLLMSLFFFAMIIDAPLLEKAMPAITPNPSKAPWYFMGFQELLMHVHPTFGSLIIPLMVLGFFIYIPFLKNKGIKTGVWFNSQQGKNIAVRAIVISAIYTFLFSIINDSVFDFSMRLKDWPSIISTGLLPSLLYVMPLAGYFIFLKRKGTPLQELIIGVVSMILSAYVTLMLTGIFLRGEGMQLIF